jgi:hypothetical protein
VPGTGKGIAATRDDVSIVPVPGTAKDIAGLSPFARRRLAAMS